MATVTVDERSRANGKSYIVYFKDPFTGRRTYHKTFRRKMDALDEANRLRHLIDTGVDPKSMKDSRRHRPMVFKDVADLCEQDWQEKVLLKELKPRTLLGYQGQLKMLRKVFGTKLMFEIDLGEIREYRKAMAVGRSNVTANRRLFVLRQVFRKALELNAVREDPTSELKYLSERDHKRNRYLLPEDIDRLLAASLKTKAKHYMPAIILLSVEHGAAKQEILDLEWKHIHFEHNLIRFFRQKNGIERTLVLLPRTREAMLNWREHQEYARHRRGITEVASDLVFAHQDGSRRSGFKSAWTKVLELAGLDDYHFHDNRHSYCSNVLLAGGTTKDIMEMIGHRDPSMTNRYTHVASIREAQIQQRLAEHYAGVGIASQGSGEHIGNTEAKSGRNHKKRAA